MDWADTPEQATFRADVRAFIAAELPERYRGVSGNWQHDRKSTDAEARDAAIRWADALASRRWIAPSWPVEYGGGGMTAVEQFIFNQEIARARAPQVGGQAVKQIGPAIIIHGTDEQRAQYLPAILSGEAAWAQGYSEPGAGSDLASLQTRAGRDGDDYIVNGQKIWTSHAQVADWLVVLVRTDPAAPKHRGISFLLVDRKTPGITIRPLIDMAFRHNFNEIFFEDARVPVANRVGEENRGWYVGMTLLDFERSRITVVVETHQQLERLMAFLRTDASARYSRLPVIPALRLQLADRAIEVEVAVNLAFRVASMQARGQLPNYEASVSKTHVSETQQRLALTSTRIFGLYSQIWDECSEHAPMEADAIRQYVLAVPTTIGGGTNEIQRNVIATRGLGLPRG